MSYSDHTHRGEYAEERHDHDGDYAAKYHRHHDDESTAAGLREDLGRAESRISELEGRLDAAVILLESVIAPKAGRSGGRVMTATIAGRVTAAAPGHYVPGSDTNHFPGRCEECDVHYLAGATWEDANRWYRDGWIGQDMWEAFAHAWATGSYRYSPLGEGYRQEPQSPEVRRLVALIRAAS